MKIAGYLPPWHGSGWAREDVWNDHSAGGQWGDYAVGNGYSARYTYTLPCGTRRLVTDVETYVEDLHALNGEEEGTYGIAERTEVREEVKETTQDDWQEVKSMEGEFEIGAYIYHSQEGAEKEARRWALSDLRPMLVAHVRLY